MLPAETFAALTDGGSRRRLDTDWLDQVAAAVDSDILESAVWWLNHTVEPELLMNEIEEPTTSVSVLVTAAEQYSQLDRAPYQVTNVHELLDSTLLMLSAKIGSHVTVVKDYDYSLPKVPAYPSDLNQVWTNLIDNAVAAMNSTDAGGRLAPSARVSLYSSSSATPSRESPRRSATKPMGEGTGLGLDLSWRIIVNKHKGALRFKSVPGDTRFPVSLRLTSADPRLRPPVSRPPQEPS
ncbi:hypothetical protein ACFZBG_06895 [Streptomyces lydicus]|uniref:hypothetical protein n=1 Tax=Streptomyces lydicus TaxID=47763 RepID=UPI0036E0FE30